MARRGGGEPNGYQLRILETLNQSAIPMDVENIRLKAGLKNWESTKAILLELVILGKILGQKTTKGWIFWTNDAFNVRSFKKRPHQVLSA